MNVVLVNPYIVVRNTDIYLSEPLGLVYLATYLEDFFGSDVNVSILDLYALGAENPRKKGDMFVKGLDDEDVIRAKIEKFKPDLIGVTCCFTGYFNDALNVIKLIKRSFPTTPLVLGGGHATLEAKSILEKNNQIDFIVTYEGELTLVELVRALKGELEFKNIEGLCYRKKNGEIVINPDRKFLSDLSVLPIPDRKFIDMEFYKKYNHILFNYTRKKPVATVMTSRGCPYKCTYCGSVKLSKRRYRTGDLDQVFQEIEMLAAEYGIREICILDDQFIMKKDRIHEFCDYFINNNKYNLAFSNIAGVSAWLADDEDLLRKMKQAGFYKLTLPVESANPETIKMIKKPIDLEQVNRLISKANKLGFWTGAFFIIGFPHETKEHIMETVEYAYNSELDMAHFFVAQPYIGTELYDIFQEEKLMKSDLQGTYIFNSWYDTLHLTHEQINDMQEQATKAWVFHKIAFYLKPKNFINSLWPKFKTTENFVYSFKILLMLARNSLRGRFENLLTLKTIK